MGQQNQQLAVRNGEAVGNYRVVRRLGEGGMGMVYEVEHVSLGVRYALKTFALCHGDVDFLKDRFMAEGKTLARIVHPNIARVFDLGTLPDGTPYFVMDLVLDDKGDARTLSDISPGECDDSSRMRWLQSIASALDCIHAEGIVHRDIKLDNMLLNAKGDTVLVDFGVSRYVHGDIKREVGVEKTFVAGADEAARKQVMGTSGYLAPEILRGGEATAASDVYALGVAFFRLLTGLWYEPGTDALRLLEPLEGPWRRILPPMLDENPDKRPTKLVEFLRAALAGRDCRRRAIVSRLALVAALLALLCGAAIYLSFSTHSTRSTRPTPTPPHTHSSTHTLHFDLGEGIRIEMVECRPANAPRFWVGASHVTNGEWRRVTGNRRDGMDDEPVTGMSLSEINRFIAELNRRFAALVPKGTRFCLPSARQLTVACTADGANAADASSLGVLGPSIADKKVLAKEAGRQWDSGMTKRPCRVRSKPPNDWGVYDIVGQGRTICRETEISPKDGTTRHLQLGPDDVAERSTVGEWGWNSTIRLALGED